MPVDSSWGWKKAIILLIGSTCITLILSLVPYSLWKKQRQERAVSDQYRITSIVQTGPVKEALKTTYLAELLGLSLDKPTQLYAFDLKLAEKKLLASPLILAAHIRLLPPSMLYIDYEVREPLARLADFANMGLDATGHLFPLTPFFPPKHLPEIYLGAQTFSWHIQDEKLDLALKVLASAPVRIFRLDVSNAFAATLGQKEIVLFTEEELLLNSHLFTFPQILRLSPKHYQEQLNHFLSLRKAMLEDYQKQLSTLTPSTGGRYAPRIIDLRIPQLAFVER